MMRLMETHPTIQIWKFVSHNAGNTNSTPHTRKKLLNYLQLPQKNQKCYRKAHAQHKKETPHALTRNRARLFPALMPKSWCNLRLGSTNHRNKLKNT
jgi:hypothetical protein